MRVEKIYFIVYHLSESELLRFGHRQVVCHNPFCNAVLLKLDFDFKIDTKIKTILNRKQKRKSSASKLSCPIRCMKNIA